MVKTLYSILHRSLDLTDSDAYTDFISPHNGEIFINDNLS